MKGFLFLLVDSISNTKKFQINLIYNVNFEIIISIFRTKSNVG